MLRNKTLRENLIEECEGWSECEHFKYNLSFRYKLHNFAQTFHAATDETIIITVERLAATYTNKNLNFITLLDCQRFIARILFSTLSHLQQSNHSYFKAKPLAAPGCIDNDPYTFLVSFHKSLKEIVMMDAELAKQREKEIQDATLSCYTFLKCRNNQGSILFLQRLPLEVVKMIFEYVYPFHPSPAIDKSIRVKFADHACKFFNKKKTQLLKEKSQVNICRLV